MGIDEFINPGLALLLLFFSYLYGLFTNQIGSLKMYLKCLEVFSFFFRNFRLAGDILG